MKDFFVVVVVKYMKHIKIATNLEQQQQIVLIIYQAIRFIY